MPNFAHISDLHLGRSKALDLKVKRIFQSLLNRGIDAVLVTGDITARGGLAALDSYHEYAGIFHETGRLVSIPGNHDRNLLGRAHAFIMGGVTVDCIVKAGLKIIRIDSTAPHNKNYLASHGDLTKETICEAEKLVSEPSKNELKIILLHHHLLPLPPDGFWEWVADQTGFPNARELTNGLELLQRMVGKVDLILHGHRHVAGEVEFSYGGRTVPVINAGSTPELMFARVFEHENGILLRSEIIKL